METRITSELAKHIYYYGDNESQHNLTRYVWERLGGTLFTQPELSDVTFSDPAEPQFLLAASFLLLPARKGLVRVQIGHGTSDKPIFRLQDHWIYDAYEHYIMSGPKDGWLYNKYQHALYAPHNRVFKSGLLRSDFIINNTWSREEVLNELGLTIPKKREVVLVCFTFNSGSLEYYLPMLKRLTKKYFVIVKMHDREFFRTSIPIKNLVWLRNPYYEPVKLFSIADYYLGDGSSLDQDWVFTDKPMVLCRPYKNPSIDVPYEYDIRNTTLWYENPQDMHELLQIAKDPKYSRERKAYREKCFYYNDGHALDRICEFVEQQAKKIVESKPRPKLTRVK